MVFMVWKLVPAIFFRGIFCCWRAIVEQFSNPLEGEQNLLFYFVLQMVSWWKIVLVPNLTLPNSALLLSVMHML